MGNRACVIFTNKIDGGKGYDIDRVYSPCIYLHWNGGPESVYGFLAELERREVRHDAAAARFVQIVGEFFDIDSRSGLSLGINNGPSKATPILPLALKPWDYGDDNGIYLVGWSDNNKIKVRRFIAAYTGEETHLVEMPPEAVEAERERAEKHPYGLLRNEFALINCGRPNERMTEPEEKREERRKVLSELAGIALAEVGVS